LSASNQREPIAGWQVLAASFTILMVAFSFALFSLPIFYPFLRKTYGWNAAQASAGGSIVLLLIGVLGPAIGKLTDRFTPKKVLLTGMCIGALALALLSTIAGLPQYYAYCVLFGIGTAAVSLVPTSMLIAPWFSTKRGLAVGVINAGVGVAGFIAPNLTRKLIEQFSMSYAFVALAALMAIPFVATLALVRGRNTSPKATAAAHRHSLAKAGDVIKMPMFWMFGFGLFFAAHTLTGIQQHLALYMTGHGVTPTNAAFALSMLLGASAVGKIGGGAIADKYSSRVSMLWSIVCLAAGIGGLLAVAPDSPAVYWSAATFGLGYGGIFNAPPLIAFEHFGTERVGTILGLFMMFFGVGTSSGGLVAGMIFDRTHNYATSFSVDLFSCGVAFLLFFAAAWVRSTGPEELAAQARMRAA
jgi:MFS family permease